MKKCELCKYPARAYCESDEASLCWDCDANVHGANFLVARHSRTLLCHACHSLTPWKADGAKLGNTVSVCERCANGRDDVDEESEGTNDYDNEFDDGEEFYTDDDDDDDVDEDEDEDENQVVPWSSTTTPPPACSSSSEDSESVTSLKRMRDQDDLYRADGEATSVDSFRSLKERRIEPDRSVQVQVQVQVQAGSRSAAIIESLKRYHNQRDTGKLSEKSEAVDVNSTGSL